MINAIARFLFILSVPVCAFCAHNPSGIGGVAQHMMDPVGLFSDFVDAACFLLGGSFLIASIIRYIEHRRNPLMSPIGTVIFLLVGGIILVLMPFASMVIDQKW